MPRVEIKDPDEDVLTGFPENGDPYPSGDPPAPSAEPTADPPQPPVEDPVKRQLSELQSKFDRQERELQELRRAAQPPAPPSKDPDDDIDWDQEFFNSPKKALARHAEIVEKRVTNRLTSAYQRDRSTQTFWDQFYDKHPDLKQDHDLVDVTLKSNLAEMSSMPVTQAMERLADLTRDRILRYAGGGTKPRAPKARAEGASPPAPKSPKKPAESDTVLSITDLIRRNKDRRRKAAGA
jgi:hypothetical protein